MKSLLVMLLAAFALLDFNALAGEYNQVLDIGDAAPAWKELAGTDGAAHSLADLQDTPVVVVVFTCNTCPVANDYEARINQLAQSLPEKVAVVAINVNLSEGDGFAEMQQRAKEQGYRYPYLYDATQQIGREYGAGSTPEFFVLSPERKIVYMGAMDDNADATQAKLRYVDAAIEAALAGKLPETKETYANGCGIRYPRQRP